MSRVASQREAEIAAAQGMTAVRLIERAQKAKPSTETLQELAIARYELSIALFGLAEFAKSDSMLAAAIADYKALIGEDPVNKRQYESEVAELILTRQSIADCIPSPALCTDAQP